jgi:GNAT superfamily N-acetyltransferase
MTSKISRDICNACFVEKAYRNYGLGSKLVDHALFELQELECTLVTLWALPEKPEDMPRLIKFYEQNGFHIDPNNNVGFMIGMRKILGVSEK